MCKHLFDRSIALIVIVKLSCCVTKRNVPNDIGEEFTLDKPKKCERKITGKAAVKSDKIPRINSENTIEDVEILSTVSDSENYTLSKHFEIPK